MNTWEENIEKQVREVIDATYEDGERQVARIDVCDIATKQIVALIVSEVAEARKAGREDVVKWFIKRGYIVPTNMDKNSPLAIKLKEWGIKEE